MADDRGLSDTLSMSVARPVTMHVSLAALLLVAAPKNPFHCVTLLAMCAIGLKHSAHVTKTPLHNLT